MPAERLQKLLAAAGYGSRRGAEALILAGRVTVDGVLASVGERADLATQRVAVDGKAIEAVETSATWMLHKPAGYLVSANDDRGRRTVYDLLQRAPRGLKYVGRLDADSEGLLLLTTDGELAHRLAHPRYEVWKTYEAFVAGEPSPEALQRLRDGVELEDGMTAPARVELVSGGAESRVRLAIREGKKREVRRMLAAVQHSVRRLIRVEVGGVHLGELAQGASRPLTTEEEQRLRVLVGLAEPSDAGEPAEVDATADGSISSPTR